MDRIAALIAAMTLEEKIGQLTMASGWHAVTGPVVPADVSADIRAGRVGSMLNLWGAEAVRAAQKIAVGESRLGIPLLIGLDVLHGHRTIFPIPLGEACAFDPHCLGGDGARGGGGGRAGWRLAGFCADARRCARSPLGPHLRRRRRRSPCYGRIRQGEAARVSGRGS